MSSRERSLGKNVVRHDCFCTLPFLLLLLLMGLSKRKSARESVSKRERERIVCTHTSTPPYNMHVFSDAAVNLSRGHVTGM